jgi:hypothetical protein
MEGLGWLRDVWQKFVDFVMMSVAIDDSSPSGADYIDSAVDEGGPWFVKWRSALESACRLAVCESKIWRTACRKGRPSV